MEKCTNTNLALDSAQYSELSACLSPIYSVAKAELDKHYIGEVPRVFAALKGRTGP